MIRTIAALAIVLQSIEPVGRLVTLSLPAPPAAGEVAMASVEVGELARGSEIVLLTHAGRLAGVISPFGIRSGNAAGTYTVPIPPEAISGKTVTLRVAIDRAGQKRRNATAEEVTKITIETVPKVSRGSKGSKGNVL